MPNPTATTTSTDGERRSPVSSSPAGITAAVVAVSAWGIGNTMIAGIPLPGLTVAFVRMLFATALYTPILYLRGGRLSLRSFRYAWNGGVAFGADVATFFVALSLTTVANAVTISALQPLVIMAFAAAMFGERIRGLHVVSAIAAAAGVALVAFGSAQTGGSSLAGDLFAVAALISWAWYFIASKRARTRLDTFEYMTALNFVALAVIAPVAALAGQLSPITNEMTATHALGILAIVLVPGTGHILINWAHQHTTLVLTSLITLGMPVISTVSAAVFLDEQILVVQVAGISLVLASLAAVIIGDSRRTTIAEATEPGP